ncbi:MAG: hypothetical protein ACKO5E_02885, partial [bacterium]
MAIDIHRNWHRKQSEKMRSSATPFSHNSRGHAGLRHEPLRGHSGNQHYSHKTTARNATGDAQS